MPIRVFLLSAAWVLLSGFTFPVTQGTEITFQGGITHFPQVREKRVEGECKDDWLVQFFTLFLLCNEREADAVTRERVTYLEKTASLEIRHHFSQTFGLSVQGGLVSIEPRQVTYNVTGETLVQRFDPAIEEQAGAGVVRFIYEAKWGTLEAGPHVQRFQSGWTFRPSVRGSLYPHKAVELHAAAAEGVSLVNRGVASAGIRLLGDWYRLGFAEQLVSHPRREGSYVFTERIEVGTRSDHLRVDAAALLGFSGVQGAQVQIGAYFD